MEIFKEFEAWEFLGGLGIFLFAMYSLEKAIRDLAGRSFKRFIRRQTSTKLRSITTGTAVTALLQSSSAVSLMVLAFVGAGIMAMENAIGVILGSNIGTTATSWIVATVGFKLDIESFALSFIGIGGLIIIFLGKSPRYSNISKLLVSFGFLFMGLSFMKDSVYYLTAEISIETLPDYGILFYLLIGASLTAAMQSSSATIAIILTGLNASLLSFEDASSMVIGANIGTTATVLLGGLRSSQIKKRVALSHLIFNISAAIIGLILLYPIVYLIELMIGSADSNAVIGIALFHTLFNIIGVIVFYPFIGSFTSWLERIVPDKKDTHTKYIQSLTPQVFDAAISGVKNEINHLFEEVMLYNRMVLEESLSTTSSGTSLTNKYRRIKLLQAEIFKFASEMQSNELNEEEALELIKLMHAARLTINSAKTLKDIRHDLISFSNEDNKYLNNILKGFVDRQRHIYQDLEKVITKNDHIQSAGEFAAILDRMKKEDLIFVNEAMKASRDSLIGETEISDVLLANRSFNYAMQLLINSAMERLLTAQEIELIEEVRHRN